MDYMAYEIGQQWLERLRWAKRCFYLMLTVATVAVITTLSWRDWGRVQSFGFWVACGALIVLIGFTWKAIPVALTIFVLANCYYSAPFEVMVIGGEQVVYEGGAWVIPVWQSVRKIPSNIEVSYRDVTANLDGHAIHYLLDLELSIKPSRSKALELAKTMVPAQALHSLIFDATQIQSREAINYLNLEELSRGYMILEQEIGQRIKFHLETEGLQITGMVRVTLIDMHPFIW